MINSTSKLEMVKKEELAMGTSMEVYFENVDCDHDGDRCEGYFVGGKQVGPYRMYEGDDGHLKEEGFFVEGKRHGMFIEYHWNGMVDSIAEYKDGKLLSYDSWTIEEEVRKGGEIWSKYIND